MFILTESSKQDVCYGDTLMYGLQMGHLVIDERYPNVGTVNGMTLEWLIKNYPVVVVHPRRI